MVKERLDFVGKRTKRNGITGDHYRFEFKGCAATFWDAGNFEGADEVSLETTSGVVKATRTYYRGDFIYAWSKKPTRTQATLLTLLL
jgi:hypothetical protein